MTQLLLALSIASARAGEADDACRAAYQDTYQTGWEFSRANWDRACAGGGLRDAREALRLAQQAWIRTCAATFLEYEKAGKLATGLAQAYCAQGPIGRAKLAQLSGIPDPAPKPPREPSPTKEPGSNNMGPVTTAINVARNEWKPEACWSGLYYTGKQTRELDPDSKPESMKWLGMVVSEQYSYYFAIPGVGDAGFRVAIGDRFNSVFCIMEHGEQLPEFDPTGNATTFGHCLTDIQVDLEAALKAAAKAGLRISGDLTAYLGALPRGFFRSDDCKVQWETTSNDWRTPEKIGKGVEAKPIGSKCRDSDEWDQGELRRAVGKPLWVIATGGRTALIDARRGRLYSLRDGELSLPARMPIRYGNVCSQSFGKDKGR